MLGEIVDNSIEELVETFVLPDYYTEENNNLHERRQKSNKEIPKRLVDWENVPPPPPTPSTWIKVTLNEVQSSSLVSFVQQLQNNNWC
jgi:hypothetical protein